MDSVAARMCCLYCCFMNLSVGILNCIVGEDEGRDVQNGTVSFLRS